MDTTNTFNSEELKDRIIDELTIRFENFFDQKTIVDAAIEHNYNYFYTLSHLEELKDRMMSEVKSKNSSSINKTTNLPSIHYEQEMNKSYSTTSKIQNSTKIEKLINYIKKGHKIMIILRGMPGSGKTFLAKSIVDQTKLHDSFSHVFSTDDYFYKNGSYVYDQLKISEAHCYNQRRVMISMRSGTTPIIIDNTNTQMWEMKSYAIMAVDFNYLIEIIEPNTWWAFNNKQLSLRNKHNVPKEKIRQMIDRYERNITVNQLLSTYGLVYKCQKPPQLDDINLTMEIGDNKTDSCNADLIKFDSNENKNKQNKIMNNVEKAWNVDEKALHSWDIVLPVHENNEIVNNSNNNQVIKNLETVLNVQDSSTMIEDNIFFYLQTNDDSLNNLKVIQGYDRDINQGLLSYNFNNISQKIKIDKSCMTDDDDLINNENYTIESLFDIFPKIHKDYLSDLYEKCNKNFHWTVDLLLASNHEQLEDHYKNYVPERNSNYESNNNTDDNSDNNEELIQSFNKKATLKSNESKSNFKSKNIGTESLKLKKIVENKFHINKKSNTDNVLKMKQNHYCNEEPIASTSKDYHYCEESDSNNSNIESSDEEDYLKQSKDLMELNLGDTCINQLIQEFGDTTLIPPKGYLPIIQISKKLANQLYTLFLESVYEQIDNEKEVINQLIIEDENFAKKLQAKENNFKLITKEENNKTENLTEIFDEQIAMKFYEKDINQWKNLTVDDLAMKLTKQKLFESFPNIGRDSLLEVFHAHNNNYKETVQVLIDSVDNISNDELDKIKQPPLSPSVITDMKESLNYSIDCQNTNEMETKSAECFREEAKEHLKKREELFEKAKFYYSKGWTDVAMFYSDLAKKQTKYYERANIFASSAFLDENASRINSSHTLDLHHLYIKEAIEALDVYLDTHINKLKENNGSTKNLFIITGRGKNSKDGVPRIKPRVKSRLQQRNVNVREVNPGLLKVKLKQYSLMTADLG